MAARKRGHFFMLKGKRRQSKQRRLEVEKDEFYQMLVAGNNTNSNGNSQHINVEKLWWLEVHQNYSDEDFKSEMH